MFEIVSKTGDLYDVLDTSDGVVDSVTASELLAVKADGTFIKGCWYKKSKLYIEIDDTYHARPIKEGQKYAFVKDIRGVVLSPMKEEKAWYQIRKGRAKLLEFNPLTIQLLRDQDNTDESRFSIGIDPGDTTGIAVMQESHLDESGNKAVFKAEIQHRKDVSKKVEERRNYRRLRRNEKRYRPARFNNRASSRRKGRIAPSIKCRKDEILRVVRRLMKHINISSIHCEDVTFDIRALTAGYKPYSWQYQKSNRLDENIRKAIILRDGCKCMQCSASGVVLEVHHIVPRRDNGNSTPDNLITLCSNCHQMVTGCESDYELYYHDLVAGRNIALKPAMHVMQGKANLYNQLRSLCSLSLCTGGDTANRRLDWGIEKTHTNDAACVTGIRCLADNLKSYSWTIKPLRKKLQTKQDTSNKAIKHRDLVWYKPRGRERIKCYVVGIRQSGNNAGYYALKSLVNEDFGPISVKSLKLISSGQSGLLFA